MTVRENLPKGTAPEDPAVRRKKLSRNTIAKIRLVVKLDDFE